MEKPNPATPAQAATPGNGEQVKPTPSVAPTSPVTPAAGGQPDEEKVTISLKEFRDLQRDHARVLSFDKRRQFAASKNNANPQPTNNGGGDPELIETIAQKDLALQEANTRALRAEVKAGVESILAKPEYSKLPDSTKELIRKNPAMLSEADNVEEALLDIEEFVREESAKISSVPSGQVPSRGSSDHETPPVINAGAPAPSAAAGLEDVSNLTGVERSRAVLRNSLKKQRGVK